MENLGRSHKEPPERIAVLGRPQGTRTYGENATRLYPNEVEYVRADLHRGAVDALREIHDARDEHALGLRAMAGRALRTMGVDPPTTRGR